MHPLDLPKIDRYRRTFFAAVFLAWQYLEGSMMRYSKIANFLGLVVIAITLLSGNGQAQSQGAGEQSERAIFVVYATPNFPVWRLDVNGDPRFDATLLIAYLKDHVLREAWNDSTLIVPSEEHAGLLIRTSRNNHVMIDRALEMLGSFAAEDAIDRIAQKRADGRLVHQHVLLFVADPNSDATRRFFDLKSDHDDQDVQEAMGHYLLQCVCHDQAELLNELNLTAPSRNGVTLAILNADGDIVGQSDAELLSQGGTLDGSLLAEFLDKHRPTYSSAREELAAAYEKAARDDKQVLVQVSGPNCGPCIKLARFFEGQAELIEKDYVYVKIDTRMLEATDVIAELRGRANGPVPWMTILSADGRTLVTGERSGMNIGYPQSEAARAHFQHMLESTSKRLTGGEIDAIIAAIGN